VDGADGHLVVAEHEPVEAAAGAQERLDGGDAAALGEVAAGVRLRGRLETGLGEGARKPLKRARSSAEHAGPAT
jgi:hypothetical protein